VYGGISGAIQSGSWEGAVDGAWAGAIQGGIGGAARGVFFPGICFVAGTKVWIDVESESDEDALTALNSQLAEARESGIATAVQVRRITRAIEDIVRDGGGEMGDGGGQWLISRDQDNPDAPLVRRRIVRTYERIAYHLQVLTLRDEAGNEQTQRVTDEHPYHREGDGWTPARLLQPGDRVRGDFEWLEVVANLGEDHPEGMTVYNLEVEEAHTYFVLAADAPVDAGAVWVHNARRDYAERVHPLLPLRRGRGRTHGVFNDKTPLVSGKKGGDGPAVFASRMDELSDDAVRALVHVEGHSVAEMIKAKIRKAVVHINYKTGPCSICRRGVPQLMSRGMKLWVVFPDGVGYFTKAGWKQVATF
jgi:hypothetical protein